MVKIREIQIMLSLMLVSISVSAQGLGGLNTIERYQQRARVSLVDEFMKRFNGQEHHPDIPPNVKNSRKNNLMMLFNLNMFRSKQDTRYKEAEAMMDLVIKKKAKIHYADSAWCAKALCDGTLNGKHVSFYLYLTVEPRGNNMYKWVISKAEGKIFNGNTSKQAKTHSERVRDMFILPDDHEINFMSLSTIVNNNSKNIESVVRKGYGNGPTSSFVNMVLQKKLKLNYVSKLEFIFEQVPGYEFIISYFHNGKSNLGWLISSFRKISNEKKHAFLESLYGKKKMKKVEKSNYTSSNHFISSENNDTPNNSPNNQVAEKEVFVIKDDTIASFHERQYVDLEERLNFSQQTLDSTEDYTGILPKEIVLAAAKSDSIICHLTDPYSKDSTAVAERRFEAYEALHSKIVHEDAANALKTALLYPKSFIEKDYMKDCTFLPDVVFEFYHQGIKRMIFSYSFYCDVCKMNAGGKFMTFDGEEIRDAVIQITLATFPNDRYMRRIAGITQ